jgi:hypothetical protein
MKKFVITEEERKNILSQYNLNEQWWLQAGRFTAHETNTGSGWDMGLGGEKPIQRKLSDQERFKMLFDWGKSWTSTAQDWTNVKSTAQAIKNELSGLGSGSALSYLSKINTKPKFAALCKNFVYDGQNLYQWLASEYSMSWGDVLNSIPSIIKTELPSYTTTDTLYA